MPGCLMGVKLLAIALLAAPAWAAQAGGTLRTCLRSDPRTFDPHMVVDESSDAVRYATAGVLVRFNRKTQKCEPALAESWRILDGGRRIVFAIRPGVKFSDGTPFTAEDAEWSLRRLLDPKRNAPGADAFRVGDGGVATRIGSDKGRQTLDVSFPAPLAGLPALFDQVAILSSKSPLGERAALGPFALEEHKPGQYVALKRNPNYWRRDASGRALPYLDAVRFDIQPNPEIELLRFRRGEVQLVARVEPDQFDRMARESPGLARDGGATLESEVLWFNQSPSAPVAAHRRAWFGSAEFRRAVSLAIGREDICRVLYKGRAAPASGPVSPSNQFWYNKSLDPPRRDPAAAAALLAKAGFRRSGDRLADASGNPVEFSIATNTSKTRQRMAAMVQQDLAGLGIRVNIVALDFPSLIERITRTLDYEASMLVLTSVDPDPNGQMNLWLSSSATHQWNPAQKTPATPWEAEIDKLMRAQASTADPARRKAHFDKVQRIVAEQSPFVYLVHRHALAAASPSLGNLDVIPLSPHALWNIDEIFLR